MWKLVVPIGALLLSGCNVYTRASADPAIPDEKVAGRQCLLETAGPSMGFGLLGALASYPSDKSALDECMADNGWIRK